MAVCGRPWSAVFAEPLIKTVSYTTGKAGHRLKWLAVQSLESGRVQQAAADEAAEAPAVAPPSRSAKQAGADPFADPFEDSKADPGAPARLHDDALEESPAKALGPTPGRSSAEEIKLDLQAPKGARPELPPTDQEKLAVAPAQEPPCPKPERLRRDYRTILDEIKPPQKPDERLPTHCQMVLVPRDRRLGWARTTFMWKATGLCHKPAYFEDESLERYGHTWGPWLQPVVSGGHFFLTVPALPYIMGLYPPGECIYTLGYYRPGSCAPYMLDPLPLSVRAGLAEGGVWTGMVFLIP